MNIYKLLFIYLILLATLLPYSNTCGSSLITDFSSNHIRENIALSRSNELGATASFAVRNLSNNEFEIIQFELLATDGVSNFYGEVSEISNGHINLNILQELFQSFTSSTLTADSLYLQNGIKSAEEVISQSGISGRRLLIST